MYTFLAGTEILVNSGKGGGCGNAVLVFKTDTSQGAVLLTVSEALLGWVVSNLNINVLITIL